MNDGDEIQRPEVLDSECIGLKISGSLYRVVHGIDNYDNQNKPASLIVMGFRFNGTTQKRRLRSVTIDVSFQGEKPDRRGGYFDPEVVTFWPEKKESLEDTEVDIEKSKSFGGNISVGFYGASVGIEGSTGIGRAFKTTARATVEVAKGLGEGRTGGSDNMVSITINENWETMGGLPDIRVPILLNRKNNDDKFIATISIKGDGGFKYNTASSIKRIVGKSPVNHPVVFDPNKLPWSRRATAEDKKTWAQEIIPEELGSLDLEPFWEASFFRDR
ncbi:hypothetical protein ABW19_dt0205612 [Dactylella cylindrospora]|nr:hypothetical protein ABW19_dt0205612 [Dactylella cylindrospora]